jgi:hypothetical protein
MALTHQECAKPVIEPISAVGKTDEVEHGQAVLARRMA